MLVASVGAVVVEAADGLGVCDQLLGRHLQVVVVAPPVGFLLTPVPPELLAEEPPRGHNALGARRRHRRATGEALRQVLDLALPLLQLDGRLRRLNDRPRDRDVEFLLRLRPAVLEPLPQQPGRAAVLLVVGGDLVEDGIVVAVEPALVGDDARAGLRDRVVALAHVQSLDRLQRVRLTRGEERLLDDPVEVDQDLAAQQAVNLSLARAVSAHQALERRGLIGRVVVDVHVGVRVQARDDQVDEVLERLLLPRAVVCPDRLEAAGMVEHAEEVFQPLVLRPGVALHVEEEVGIGRLGQQREAELRTLGRHQLVDRLACLALPHLQLGLLAQTRQRRGADAGRR